jgi:hypothetical protein
LIAEVRGDRSARPDGNEPTMSLLTALRLNMTNIADPTAHHAGATGPLWTWRSMPIDAP